MKALTLANASTANKRRDLDFYPTPPEATHALMGFLQLPWDTLVWEPACGDGTMSRVLAQYVRSTISSDIRDTGFGDGGVDFLQTKRIGVGAVITNPPFNVSEQFIRHALTQAPVVAMLLKSQYWHAAKRTDLFYEHPPSWVLPLNWRPDFMGGERGGAPTMEVAWSVWRRDTPGTHYHILRKPQA